MLRSLKFVAIALATLLVVEPAIAQYQTNRPLILRKLIPPVIRPNLSNLPNVLIRPSQAAAIAKAQVPNSKVIKLSLLPSGIYAVTLVAEGNVTRVFVNGQDGSPY